MTTSSTAPGPRAAAKGTGTITAAEGAAHARIMGVGGYRPARVVPNSEIVEAIDSSDEWIQERSGIKERRFAAKDESVVDMSVEATRGALEAAGLEAAEVDAVVLATVTHPYQTPAAAPIVADRLGIRGAAFDISAACAGYAHGISLANDMVRGGSARHVLVIGVEKLSDFTDMTDRGSAFIFGDGAGAAVVGPGDAAIGPVVLQSDGSLCDAITMSRDEAFIRMDGHDTFKAAVTALCETSLEACARAGLTLDDIDVVAFHQANGRILSAAAERLQLPEEKLLDYIADTGNTSAASIPLTLSLARADGRLRTGDRVLVSAVGAGFTAGAAVLDWGVA
jgi:3-oxoacyl-[acyl-carrier-protein] synthase III